MKRNILYLGIDVHENLFHCGIFIPLTGEVASFKCKATVRHLFDKVKKYIKEGYNIKCCYEATFIGYNLYRELNKKKHIECVVIAPSLIPKQPGKKVKTDKIDALKLAEYHAKNLLTEIHVPTKEEEATRALLRSRKFLVEESKRVRQHILSLCKMIGINYKEETGGKNYWTKSHIKWLEEKLEGLNEDYRLTLETLLLTYVRLKESINKLEYRIEEISKSKRYETKVKVLRSFRGIDTLTAMTLITEIIDINRFSHPKQLMSYAGFDVVEYSSGGKERKYGITKMGNKHIRRVLTESSQFALYPQKLSRRLKAAREEVDDKIVEISERCMERLYKKGTRLRTKGKAINKIKTACAREMLGFIWEALKKVS